MKKSFTPTLTLLFASATPAAAALNPETEAFGLMARLFLIFLALIFAAQLLPGLMLLVSMVRGLFGKNPRTEAIRPQ